MATYQDKTGKSYKTKQQAREANRAMGSGLDKAEKDLKYIQEGINDLARSRGVSLTKTDTGYTATPITSDSLKTTPAPNVTQPKKGVETAGMLGEMQAGTDMYTKGLQDKAEKDKLSMTTSRSAYDDFLKNLQGKETLTDERYRKDVDPIEKELTQINQDILVEQRSLENKVRELEKNQQGKFGGALEDQIEDVRRESLRKQADLSVIQMGVQGRYDSAKSIADRAITAYLEKQQILNETLRLNYEDNKDIFDKSEQRAFESAQYERERTLKQKETDLKDISDLSLIALENGAPSSIVIAMRGAKSLDDAILAGAQYLRRHEKASSGSLSNEDIRSFIRNSAPEISSEAISQLSEKELEDFAYAYEGFLTTGGSKLNTTKEDPFKAMQDVTNYGGKPRTTLSVSQQTPKDFFNEYKKKIGKKVSGTSDDLVSKINAAFGE